MRIYKPAYSKPLPADAKIKRDKEGPYVLLTDREGQPKKCRVTETDKGRRMSVESSYYTIVFRDHAGTERRLQGYREKAGTEALAEKIGQIVYRRERSESLPAELQEWVDSLPEATHGELAGFGLVKARRAVVSQDLEDLLTGFEEFLSIKRERSSVYVSETVSALRKVFAVCGFEKFADIDDVAVEKYLLELRKDKTVTVNGKERVKRGLSKRTLNGYVGALQQFCKWAVRKQKAAKHNPLDQLEKYDNEADDRRQIRRPLTRDEVDKLLTKTAEGPERFGMDGRERALLYRVALETGLRANELRTLDVEHLDFSDPGGPVLYVDASYSKHRERDALPIRPELAKELQAFILERRKLPTAKLFGGRYQAMTDKPAKMFKEDLKAAEIEQKTVAGVLVFHSLRHTFVSSLKALPSRQAQGLARHKSSDMTDRYTHRTLEERRALLNQVPFFGVAG